jgi:hypothetical protein
MSFSPHSRIQATVTAMAPYAFKGQVADFYEPGIQKLVPRLNKCLDNASDYVEK